MRTLSPVALNRALLARQGLLERRRLPIPRVLERIAGIQAQYAPSMYVGLWSRMEGLERGALTAALERRTVVQGTLMRVTIHLVSRADYWPFALATRDARRALWLRTQRDSPSAEEMAAASERLRAALDERSPLRATEVADLLGHPAARAAGLWLDLVRVPPSGTWERRRADLLAAATDWVGPPPTDLDAGAAGEHLVRRYLGGFGPASRADIARFTGLPQRELPPLLERLTLRRFRSHEGDEELLDLPRAPLPDPETPAPPRFLPTFDATLWTHARRTGVLPEEHRTKLFTPRRPHSLPSFLVDGRVAGTWRHEHGRIQLDPFHRLDPASLRALREEGERLAGFLRP